MAQHASAKRYGKTPCSNGGGKSFYERNLLSSVGQVVHGSFRTEWCKRYKRLTGSAAKAALKVHSPQRVTAVTESLSRKRMDKDTLKQRGTAEALEMHDCVQQEASETAQLFYALFSVGPKHVNSWLGVFAFSGREFELAWQGSNLVTICNPITCWVPRKPAFAPRGEAQWMSQRERRWPF